MSLSQEDFFGPSASPSSFIKADPMLANFRISDLDDPFPSFTQADTNDWFVGDCTDATTDKFANDCVDLEPIINDLKSCSDEWNLPNQKSATCAKSGIFLHSSMKEDSMLLPSSTYTSKQASLCEPCVKNCQKIVSDVPKTSNINVTYEPSSRQDFKRNVRNLPTPIKEERDSSPTKHPKRGRPMKITSHSKQALYARQYRLKNKQALWSYEKMVAEQNMEIAALVKENQEMRERLSELTRKFMQMKRLLAAHPSLAAKLPDAESI